MSRDFPPSARSHEIWLRVQDDFRNRRWAEVVRALAPAIDGSRHLEAIRLFALSLAELGQVAPAIDLMHQAVVMFPQSAVAHVNQASVLRMGGEFALAEQALRQAMVLDPLLAAAPFNLGILLRTQGRLEDARAPFERAVALAPNRVDARVMLGEVAKALGDIEAAVTQFRAAIALRPQCGSAWWGIANLKTVKLSMADRDRLDILWSEDLPALDRETLGFARAHAHLAHSDSNTAWQMLLEANRTVARSRPFDGKAFEAEVERATAAMQAPLPEAGPTQLAFVVGLPRSGTTLVEQILAAHSRVAAAGELQDLFQLVEARRKRHGAMWRQSMQDTDWRELGAAYLARTGRSRPEGKVMVDKLPGNIDRVDVILRMHPGARVVVCQRDARDNALGCLLQYFAIGSAFSFDLDAIATYRRGCNALAEEAVRHAPERVIVLSYESLVQAPETVIPQVLAFLGLPLEAACLRPEQVRRAVRSASAAQVIEAIDQRGVGRWQRFATEFQDWDAHGRFSTSN